MTDGPAAQNDPGLLRTVSVLRERWWIVAAAALACTLGALAYSATRPDQYSASARLLFENSNLADQIGGVSSTPDVNPEVTQATNILLVTTHTMAGIVKEALKLTDSPDGLLDEITVEADSSSNIVALTITDADPGRAAQIANTWADQFVAYRRQRAVDQVRAGEATVRQQIAALPQSAVSDRQALLGSLAKLIQVEALQTGDVAVVDRATVPGAPSSPNPKRNAIIALLLGAVIGVGLAFLLNLLDRRAKTVEDVEELYALRALAAIPLSSPAPSSSRASPAVLEPFRLLRDSLVSVSALNEVRVVLVTSATAGEGKSTVAAALAQAFALSGKQTVLVEADLRRPQLHQHFDLGGDPRGLTNALVGNVPAAELVRAVLPGLPTLTVVPAGPIPPNSAELLRSAQMNEVLLDLLDEAQIVILDAPPLLPVADTHALLDNSVIDTALIVARVNRTTRDQARRAHAILERHPDRTFGLVVNGVRDGGG